MAIPFNLPSDEETEDHYKRLDQLLKDLYVVLRQILFRPRPFSDGDSLVRGRAASLAPMYVDSLEERLLALPDLVQSAMIPSHHGAATMAAAASAHRPPPPPPPPPTYSAAAPAPTHDRSRPRHCHQHCHGPAPAPDPNPSPGQSPSASFLHHHYVSQPCSQSYGSAPLNSYGRLSGVFPKIDLMSDQLDAGLEHSASHCNPHLLSSQPLPRRFIGPTKSVLLTKLTGSPGKSNPHTRHKRWTQVGEELRSIAEDFRSNFSVRSSQHCPMELKASSLFSLLIPATIGQSVWTTVIFLVGWRILVYLR